MNAFSWKDGLRATVGTCLPCFACTQRANDDETENEGRASSAGGARGGYAHYTDELEGLLGDSTSLSDAEAETLSLHSNVGTGVQRKRKKKKRARWATKSVQLFGFHLFGRPTPPIQLPESDHESDGEEDLARRRRRLGRIVSAHSSSSTSDYDADAAPLDPAAIAALSAQEAAARAERDVEEARRRAEEQAEREERKRRRRERKELKKAAAALALGTGDDGDFEGFPGSGNAPTAPAPYLFAAGRGPTGDSSPPSPAPGGEDFGPYVHGHAIAQAELDDAGDDDADFGGTVYTRSVRSRGSNSGSSASRSQTSASRSNASSTVHNSLPPSPLAANFDSATKASNLHLRPHIPQIQSKSSNSNASSTSPSASPSLGSPIQPAFVFAQEPHVVGREGESDSFPRPGPGLGPHGFARKGVGAGVFPSVGFGGVRRANSSGLGSGVFLARMGED